MKKIKFADWAEIWIERKKNYVKESTYANYMIGIKNHLIPKLGEYYMEDITPNMIQEMIFTLCTCGRKDGRGGLSVKTVKDLITIMKMCFKDYGTKDGWIYNKNIFRYPTDSQVFNTEILEERLYERMLQIVENEKNFEAIGYAISLFTGMRIGEVCALQWKDIDLEQKIIYVKKTLQRIYFKDGEKGKTKLIIGMPKSKSAIRELPIAKRLEKILRNYICEPECYVLSGDTKFIEPRLYRKHFQKFLKKNHFKHMRFHDLRHNFATRCIDKGGDYKTVSCLLGHSSVSITFSRYVHPQMKQKRKCVELI